MQTLLYTLFGIIVGGIISYIISKFYYKKSIKTKSLSAFVQFMSDILSDIDAQVKKKLSVLYDTHEVQNLYQMQFVIANTGDFSVKDIIQPLTLEIPKMGVLLDVNIIHIEPDGRVVQYEIYSNEQQKYFVKFVFPLLNSGEYFVVKLLIKGEMPKPNKVRLKRRSNLSEFEKKQVQTFDIYSFYTFTITAEDLPPQIKSSKLPFDYLDINFYPKFDYSSLIGGITILFLDVCLIYIIYALQNTNPNLAILQFKLFFSNFTFLSLAIIFGWLLVIVFLIASFAIPLSEISSLRPRKKPKFLLPTKVTRPYWDL